uniref:Cytochrome c oxidase subunit 2 n=1 Tax=Pseudosuccinea columella TaxID=31228 RepID=A0A4P8Y7W5_PSECM|nr:cytochrome c oxidase subunit II [Pseudosuccinea columella]QCT09598.1 cytochrome c oxidase subunit 2 [Pseudosuccinea columella]
MSIFGQLNLMDPATPIQEEMILFHDHALVLLIGIFLFVVILGVNLITNKMSSRTMLEAQQLETIWTIIPALLLIWLALPSLRLLYLLDEQPSDGLVLKSTAHQWYWSHEIPMLNNSFDSYMVPLNDLDNGMFRLLEVDNRITVPFNVNTNIITTSADVLHAFAIPAMGVKMDAVPGRLNSMNMFINNPGIYYGQCSEICGANHSFMPIVLEAISIEDLFF